MNAAERDDRAKLAYGLSKTLSKQEAAGSVAGRLGLTLDEARKLIRRGRRLAVAPGRPRGESIYSLVRSRGQSDREKLEANCMPVTECGCWIWLRSLGTRGYGQMFTRDRIQDRTHRVSYRIYKGEIPDGMQVLHTCDIRVCVNPDHLYLGTDVENSRDRHARGRHINPPHPGFGEQSTVTKVSDQDTAKVLASSESNPVLARRYGVSTSCIWRIKNGKRRKPPVVDANATQSIGTESVA